MRFSCSWIGLYSVLSSAACSLQNGKRFVLLAFRRVEEAVDGVGGLAWDDGSERADVGFFDAPDASEVLDEAGASERADSWDREQLRVSVAHLAALAVIGDGKAVRFVANSLHEMQHWGAAVENDRIVFLAIEVYDFFPLGNGGKRLGGDAE